MQRWRMEPARDLGLPLGQRLRSLHRESGLIDRTARLVWWSAVRVYFVAVHRLKVKGREHLPTKPPFVIVANHSSHLDAIVLAAAMPGRLWNSVFPIAAGDTFFETPARAAFAAGLLNALPMWRRNCGSHAMRELRERLVAEPCGYILFPEGTRSRTGEMTSFKPGLGMIVAETDVPVVPVYIHGAYEAAPPGRRLPRPGRIELRVGPALRFANSANERPAWRDIAGRAEKAVRALATSRGE
ncbi:MAG: lysophospholipid acyltransferase family protein [Phycisphaerales bacterium]